MAPKVGSSTAKRGTRQVSNNRTPPSRQGEPSSETRTTDAVRRYLEANQWTSHPNAAIAVANMLRAAEVSDRWPELASAITAVGAAAKMLHSLAPPQQTAEVVVDPLEKLLRRVS